MKNNIHAFTVKDAAGTDVKLADYDGKVLLIVNVASECGFTRQYKGLQSIYEKYSDRGFEILAFPCNDFGGQEPGTNEEIAAFCTGNFGVTFKLFDKISILGNEKSPLYRKLTDNEITGKGDVKWNFEKFLISREGDIVQRFRSGVEPGSDQLTGAIERELSK